MTSLRFEHSTLWECLLATAYRVHRILLWVLTWVSSKKLSSFTRRQKQKKTFENLFENSAHLSLLFERTMVFNVENNRIAERKDERIFVWSKRIVVEFTVKFWKDSVRCNEWSIRTNKVWPTWSREWRSAFHRARRNNLTQQRDSRSTKPDYKLQDCWRQKFDCWTNI